MKKLLLKTQIFLLLLLVAGLTSQGQTSQDYVKNANYPMLNDGYIKLWTDTFVSPINYNWNTGATTKNIFNLTPGTYSITFTDANNQSAQQSFEIGTTINNYQFPWEPTATIVTHTVCVPGGSNVTINGQTLLPGDKIGIFYDSLGYWACSDYFIWDGTPHCLTAYYDTLGEQGFADNEQFRFLIRSSLYGFDFIATPFYDLSSPFLDDSLFVQGGESQLLNLTADSLVLQTTLVKGNTNDFYSFVNPLEPNCQQVFYYYNTNYYNSIIVHSPTGQIYWSQYALNTIGNVVPFVNYKIKTTELTIFQFEGILLDTVSYNLKTNTCYNIPDGFINVVATFGIPPYSYIWNTGEITANITDIPANTSYSVTITDSQLTQQTLSFNSGSGNLQPDFSFTLGNTSVINGGFAEVEVNNVYVSHYYWSNGDIDTMIINQPAGTYFLTIEDGYGCLTDTSVTITNGSFSVNMYQTNVSSNTASDGSAWCTVSGAALPYSYLWSTGATTSTISGLSAGIYSVTVTDNNNDIASGYVQITSPLTINPNIIQPSSSSASDGSIILIVTGGQSPYTYNWQSGAATPSVSGLPIGQYNVTVTDILGNSFPTQIYLDVIEINNFNTYTSTPTSCDGGIDISITGGFAPFVYSWTNGATTQNINNICSDIYSLTVTDAIGYTISTDISLIMSSSISFNAPVITGITHVIAFLGDTTDYLVNGSPIGIGDMIGAFYQNSNGWACAGYFEWTGNPTLNTVTIWGDDPTTTGIVEGYQYGEEFKWFIYDSSTGLYYYEIATYNPTFVNDQYYWPSGQSGVETLGYPLGSLSFIINTTPTSCYNGYNGTATISNLTGLSPFTILWSTGESTQGIVNLTSGNYSVTVTDNNNQQISQIFQISQPLPLEINSNITYVSVPGMSDGQINISVSGGVSPYLYSWTNGSTTQDINSLPYGYYSVLVTDLNLCTQAEVFLVDSVLIPLLGSGTISNVSCNSLCDGSIDVSLTGGIIPLSLIWSNGETTEDISNLCAGNYNLDVFENGTFTPGPTYPWNSVINTGINHIILISQESVHINGVAPPAGSILGVFYDDNGLLKCGGYYEYQNSVFAVTAWGDSPYSIGIKDGFDNAESFQWFILIDGVSIHLSPTYGSGFSNGGNYATGGMSGIIALNGTYMPDLSLSFTITEPDSLQLHSSITDATVSGLNNGSVNITVSGGVPPYSFVWSNGETTEDITSLSAGSYQVTITDANLCNVSGSFNVDLLMFNPLDVSQNVSDPNCPGACNGSIDLTVSGGIPPFSYSWSNGETTEDIINLCEGVYSVEISDNGSISNTTPFPWVYTISVSTHTILIPTGSVMVNGLPPAPGAIIGAFYNDNGILECGGYTQYDGADVAITVWGDYSGTPDKEGFDVGEGFIWQIYTQGNTYFLEAEYNPTGFPQLGTYVVNGISGLLSLQTSVAIIQNYSFTITDPDSLHINYSISPALGTYSNGTINILVTGGVPPYSYLWSNGITDEDLTGVPAGTYSLVVTDAGGCELADTFIVSSTIPSVPLNASGLSANTTCNGVCDGAISLNTSGGLPPYYFNWSTGDTTEDINNLCPGIYTVTVSSSAAPIPQMPWEYVNTNNFGEQLGGAVNVNSQNSQPGDFLGAFYIDNGNYVCAGYSEINSSGATSIIMWEDDSATPLKDGFQNGDIMYFKLWRYSDGSVVDMTMTDIYGSSCGIIFCTGGTSLVEWNGNYTPPAYSPLVSILEFEITEPATLSVNSVITTVDPTSNNNGAIDITISGGTSPYVVTWSNGATSEDITGLSSGNYSVTIDDAAGCSLTTSYMVEYSYIPTLPSGSAISTVTSCNLSCDGEIDLTPSGGVPPYSFQWSTGATTEDISNLCAGNYDVTITDSQSTYSAAFPYTANDSLAITIDASTEIEVCFWASHSYVSDLGFYLIAPDNSRIDLMPSVSGWDQGITNLIIGDVLSCDPADWYSNCNSGNNIQNFCFSTTLPAGNPAYTPCICDMPAPLTGTFASCEGWEETYNQPVNGPWKAQIIDCSFSEVGFIQQVTLKIKGQSLSGEVEYNYNSGPIFMSIDDGQCDPATSSSFTFSNYTVSLLNPTQNHKIIVDPLLSVNGNTPDTGDYLAIFYMDNGIEECGGYTIWSGLNDTITVWADNATTTNKDGFDSGEDFRWKVWKASTGLLYNCAAAYDSGYTNQGNFALNGESSIISLSGTPSASSVLLFIVTEPDTIGIIATINSIDPGVGNDGEIDISVTGGTPPYSYLWSTGNTNEDLTNLSYGSYSVTITDSNLCSVSESYMVTFSGVYLDFDIISVNIDCYGNNNGQASVNIINGIAPYSYLWSNGETTSSILNLTPGFYDVTVSAANGDEISNSIEITEPDELLINISPVFADPVLLIDGSIDLLISGGTNPYTILWSDGSTTEDILSAPYGSYSVTVSDINSCQVTGNTFVDFNLLPDWNFNLSGITHSIEIPQTALMQMNGVSLGMNDFIGVFYDSLGNLSCGGYIIWKETTATLYAYGDNPVTTEPDGFTAGEEFEWIIWDVSENTEHFAAPSYNTTYPDQQFWVANGQSGIDSLQVVTISGSVSTTSRANLPLGMVVLYKPVLNSYVAVEKGLVIDGQFEIEGVLPGDYLVYAIPAPGNDYGIPGYFVQRDGWQNASLIHAYAYTGGIDIEIDPVLPYNTGNGAISGNIYVGSDNSYNPNVFGDEWFPGSLKDGETPARNIPVLLYDDQMHAMDFRLTNDGGSFEFTQMEFGTYFIRVEKAGLVANEIEITLSAENPVSDGTVFTLEDGQVVSLPEMIESDNFIIYPNPVRNELFIQMKNNNGKVLYIKMYSITGQEIEITEAIQNDIISIDTRDLSQGIYLLEIKDNKGRMVYKVNKN